jgi:diguanylate cyclase (GGDEF)-like protein
VSDHTVPGTQRGVVEALADAAEVAASRERVRTRLLGRERTVTYLLAGGFLVAAAGCALFLPSDVGFSAWVAALLVACYALVSQVEFETGPGSAVPTELVLVPMLFAVPPGVVPVLVASGLVLGGLLERARSRRHGERVAVLLCSSWHSVGPALVIGLLATGEPNWDDLPVYALAFAAQLVLDWASVLVRHTLGRGVPARDLVRPLAAVAVVDAGLAPLALLAAFAIAAEPVAILGVLPTAGLLYVLGVERRRRLDEGIVLSRVVDDERRVARSDPLTGVGNRLAWRELLHEAQHALDHSAVGASVFLVDLDRLKETNDTFGHDAGDRRIQALAATLLQSIPERSSLARIGGDEFAILVPDFAEDGAQAVAAAIRRRMSETSVNGIPLHASVGFASCPPCASLDDALRMADARLYDDKAAMTARDP